VSPPATTHPLQMFTTTLLVVNATMTMSVIQGIANMECQPHLLMLVPIWKLMGLLAQLLHNACLCIAVQYQIHATQLAQQPKHTVLIPMDASALLLRSAQVISVTKTFSAKINATILSQMEIVFAIKQEAWLTDVLVK
jgi:hypothetical protein